MKALASLADDIFGPSDDLVGDRHLTRLLELLQDVGVDGLAVLESDGTLTAASHHDILTSAAIDGVREELANRSSLPCEIERGDRRYVFIGIPSSERISYLVISRPLQVLQWNAPQWLTSHVEIYLHNLTAERSRKRTVEEFEQLRRQHEVMQQEHHRLLLSNLREHNARLEEQSLHLHALECQVQERTHDLTTASDEIAARNRELEETNDRLEMQVRRRRRTEAALRESAREAKRLAVVASKTSNLVAILDERGRIDWINESFADTSGYSLDECLGRDPFSLLKGPGTNLETISRIRDAVAQARLKKVDILQYTRSGRTFWNAIEIQPVFSDAGKVTSFILIGSDVTQEHETARLLKEARDTAEKAARMKSEFLANMSHEVRSPLTAILGHTDILVDEENAGNAPPQRIRSLRAIKRNGEHLLNVVNDILDFSKIEAEEIELETVECQLTEVIQGILHTVRSKASSKGISLQVDCLNPIPSVIRTDPVRLSQILINLLANAVKFTKHGTVTLALRFLADNGKARLQFSVSDTGIGMNPGQVAGLFTPFYQADPSTTRQFGGTGLGLSITKRLVDLFQGTIQVQSIPDVGTTFHVHLPISVSLDCPLVRDIQRDDLADSSLLGSPLKQLYSTPLNLNLLVAEDRSENQVIIEHVLGKAGARLTIVGDGLAVLEQLAIEALPFDVILLDMQMPKMDGYQCARELRARGYIGGIIALTAHATKDDEEKCLGAGCDFYITKPIDWHKLFDTIRKAAKLESTRSVSSLRQPSALGALPPNNSIPADEFDCTQRTEKSCQDDLPVVDWHVLTVDCALDEVFASQLIGQFVDRITEDLLKLRSAIEAHELPLARNLAHGIKGTAGTLGLKRIYRATVNLERHLHTDNPAESLTSLAELNTESLSLSAEIHQHLTVKQT